MKRASYRDAVAWIAMNDDAGSSDWGQVEVVSGYVTVCLVADLFGVDSEKVAKDVVTYREKEAKRN